MSITKSIQLCNSEPKNSWHMSIRAHQNKLFSGSVTHMSERLGLLKTEQIDSRVRMNIILLIKRLINLCLYDDNQSHSLRKIEPYTFSSAKTLAVPGAPSSVTVADVEANEVALEWTKPRSDGGRRINGYVVEYKPVNSDEWKQAPGGLVKGLNTTSKTIPKKIHLHIYRSNFGDWSSNTKIGHIDLIHISSSNSNASAYFNDRATRSILDFSRRVEKRRKIRIPSGS